jgi:hypothetical protein
MGVISPKAEEYFMNRMAMPVTEMLMQFMTNEGTEKSNDLLKLLDGSVIAEDEYLKGIMREKK